MIFCLQVTYYVVIIIVRGLFLSQYSRLAGLRRLIKLFLSLTTSKGHVDEHTKVDDQ